MYGDGAIHSKRREVKNKRQAWIYFFLGVFAAGGIISGLWNVPRYPQLLIENINIKGNSAVSVIDLKKEVRGNLQGAFYIFFPKKHSFWYPKEKIEKSILSNYPRVASALVSLSDVKNLNIEVRERDSYALFCGGDTTNPGKCFFLDDEGFVFAEAPDFTGSVYKRFFSTSTEIVLGEHFLEEPDFKSINLFNEELLKNGLSVNTITIEKEAIKLGIESGGKILIDKEMKNPTADLENLKTLISSKEFKGKDESGKFNFEYIDLRFGNKLFYKL